MTKAKPPKHFKSITSTGSSPLLIRVKGSGDHAASDEDIVLQISQEDGELHVDRPKQRAQHVRKVITMILLALNLIYSISMILFYFTVLIFLNIRFHGKISSNQNKIIASMFMISSVIMLTDVIISAIFFRMVDQDANQDKMPKNAKKWWTWSIPFMVFLLAHVILAIFTMFINNELLKSHGFLITELGAIFASHFLAFRAVSYYVIFHCYIRKRSVPLQLPGYIRSGATRFLSILDMVVHATSGIVLLYQVLDAILVYFGRQHVYRWPNKNSSWSVFGDHNARMYLFKMIAGSALMPFVILAFWSAQALWIAVDMVSTKPKKALMRIHLYIAMSVIMMVVSPVELLVTRLDFYEETIYFAIALFAVFLFPCRIMSLYLVCQFRSSIYKANEGSPPVVVAIAEEPEQLANDTAQQQPPATDTEAPLK